VTTVIIRLSDLSNGKIGKIIGLNGGQGLRRKLRTIGIREGKLVKLVTAQPIGGPIVIDIDGEQIAIGRGMAQKIMIEVSG
jgi:ferrous iron transport protein A